MVDRTIYFCSADQNCTGLNQIFRCVIPHITKSLNDKCLPFNPSFQSKSFHIFMVVTRFLDPKEDASAGRCRPARYSSLPYGLSCYTSLCINIITDLPVCILYPSQFTQPFTVFHHRFIYTVH